MLFVLLYVCIKNMVTLPSCKFQLGIVALIIIMSLSLYALGLWPWSLTNVLQNATAKYGIYSESIDTIGGFTDDSLCPGAPLNPYLPKHLLSPAAQPLVQLTNTNISFCTVPKVASWTFLHIILNLVQKYNGYSSLVHNAKVFQSLGPPPDSSWNDNSWNHIIVTRDPIERFVSGYMDICGARKHFLCSLFRNISLSKFIQMNYKSFLSLDKQRKSKRLWTNESWFCKLDERKLQAMDILHLNKDNPLFKEAFLSILHNHKISPTIIRATRNEIESNFVHEMKRNRDKQKLYTQIYSDKRLLFCLLKLYKYDFELFHFDITKYIKMLQI